MLLKLYSFPGWWPVTVPSFVDSVAKTALAIALVVPVVGEANSVLAVPELAVVDFVSGGSRFLFCIPASGTSTSKSKRKGGDHPVLEAPRKQAVRRMTAEAAHGPGPSDHVKTPEDVLAALPMCQSSFLKIAWSSIQTLASPC